MANTLSVTVFIIAFLPYQIFCRDGDRIVGGVEAEPLEFPWQVSLQYDNRHICGGSVINDQWILTAAHCAGEIPFRYSVLVGEHNFGKHEGTEYEVKPSKIIQHRFFNPRTLDYDLALFKLKDRLDFAGIHRHIKPITLPDAGTDFTNATCTSSGWGLLSHQGDRPYVLQKVELPIWNQEKCVRAYEGINTVTGRMMCAGYPEGGKSPCNGDSGGPLHCKQSNGDYFLAGAVSWGTICAEPGFPGVFSKISAFRSWIDKILEYN